MPYFYNLHKSTKNPPSKKENILITVCSYGKNLRDSGFIKTALANLRYFFL